MKRYEVVREIANSCERNQMRDVLFFEVDTDDPVEWVRREIKGGEVHLTAESFAEFALAGAKESNHFSDDMRVRKILLGRQCVRRTRAAGRKSFGRKVVRLFASLNLYLHP